MNEQTAAKIAPDSTALLLGQVKDTAMPDAATAEILAYLENPEPVKGKLVRLMILSFADPPPLAPHRPVGHTFDRSSLSGEGPPQQ